MYLWFLRFALVLIDLLEIDEIGLVLSLALLLKLVHKVVIVILQSLVLRGYLCLVLG